MPPGFGNDSLSLCTHYLRMMSPNDSIMATGTGFLYEYENEIFLITNGHNITRTNPEGTKRILESAAFPVAIKTTVKGIIKKIDNGIEKSFLHASELILIDIYEDLEFVKPLWFMHPTHGYLVDVVAIPVARTEQVASSIKLSPINKFEFDTKFPLQVADDVFVLGYPFNIYGKLELPIWKRGSVATEPFLDFEDLPKFLIDTATRSGMSGSPVIMRRSGYHLAENEPLENGEMGLIQQFVGIYSGRLGADNEFQAQLGIVWKEKVIVEILEAKKPGTIEFQKI